MNRTAERMSTRRARGGGRRRDVAVAGGALALVVAVAGGSLLWGAASAAFGRDAAIATASVLAESQASADRLPPGFPADQHGDGGIVASSSRVLGERAGTRYWIALDQRSNVCVLAQSVTSAELTAAACSAAGDLELRGASLRVESPSWKLEAFLLPDSVDASSLSGPWTAVADNLVTYSGPGSAGSDAAGSVQLKRDPGSSGAPITLTREPGPAGG